MPKFNIATITEFLSRRATILTLVYCWAFLCLGLFGAALGPSLPSIGRNTNTSDQKLGVAVTSRAFGYLVGSFSGPLYHRLPGNRMMSCGLAAVAIFCFFLPHLSSYTITCALMFFKGVASGVIDTGGNLGTLWLHGANCDPYIQALHSSFAVGAVISPAIIKGLLTAGHSINAAWYAFGIACLPVIGALLYFKSPSDHKEITHEIIELDSTPFPPVIDEQAATKAEIDDYESGIKGEVAIQLDSIASGSRPANEVELGAEYTKEDRERGVPPPSPFNFTWENRYNVDYKPYLTVLGVALFLGCYIGGELATGSFLTTFALRRGITTEDGGALMTTLFWLSFALGRVAAIPLSVFLSPRTIMIIDLSGTMIASCFIWVFVDQLVPLTIAIVLYGGFMASTFPSAITLLQSIIPVTGSTTTIFVIGASLGAMVVPLIVSSSFESTQYMSLIYVQFGSAASGTIVMVGVGFLGWLINKQKLAQANALTHSTLADPSLASESSISSTQDIPVTLDEEVKNDHLVKLEL